MHYVLIDYENVQPDISHLVEDFEADVTVFLGARQRINRHTDESVWRMDMRAEIIKMTTTGRNALDFHLAFHLGQLVMANPAGSFEIISNDKGYDSLIERLADKGVVIRRTGGLQRSKPQEVDKGLQHHSAKTPTAGPGKHDGRHACNGRSSVAQPSRKNASANKTGQHYPPSSRDIQGIKGVIRALEKRLGALRAQAHPSVERRRQIERIMSRLHRLRGLVAQAQGRYVQVMVPSERPMQRRP